MYFEATLRFVMCNRYLAFHQKSSVCTLKQRMYFEATGAFVMCNRYLAFHQKSSVSSIHGHCSYCVIKEHSQSNGCQRKLKSNQNKKREDDAKTRTYSPVPAAPQAFNTGNAVVQGLLLILDRVASFLLPTWFRTKHSRNNM